MTKPGPEQPMQIYDTVLVDLPAGQGSQHKFFLDLRNKNENLCNLHVPRRIDAGDRLTFTGISIDVANWSGDHLLQHVWSYGWLEVKVNRTIVFADSLRKWGTSGEEYAIEVTDQDDLSARLVMLAMPPEWGEPKTTEYVEKQRTEEEEIAWPERTRWLTKRLGLWTPKLKRTSTWMEPVSRPLKGQAAVMLKLIGRGTKPVGA